MSMNEQMEESEASILHTYNRFPVVFEKGEGCYLYDSEGKEYLDFAAGIAVNALGYHYPGYDEALKSQIDKLMHISCITMSRSLMQVPNLYRQAIWKRPSSQTVVQRPLRVL